MEVHHHSSPAPGGSHTPRKKWTHYFWEFLMLFLAVFCGFLAEYQLEQPDDQADGAQTVMQASGERGGGEVAHRQRRQEEAQIGEREAKGRADRGPGDTEGAGRKAEDQERAEAQGRGGTLLAGRGTPSRRVLRRRTGC